MHWRSYGGYEWCLLDTAEPGPYLSLTLGYGIVDEPLHQFGTLQLLAGMLQAELSRPVETGPGRASVPEVSAYVGSDTTTVSMRGDLETLRATWRRLADIFAQRQPLDPAPPVAVNITAAPRDVSSRFGITSLTLATSQALQVETSHDPVALLRYLNPAAGNVRAVMCTNTEELITDDFATPDMAAAESAPSRYRSGARSGGMEFPSGHALLSMVVPRTADGETAVRVLAQHTARQLGALTHQDPGVSVSLVPIGPDMLATIMSNEMILRSQPRSQLHDHVVSRPIPDHWIETAVDRAHEHRSVSAALDRRVHGLADAPASVEGTHQALARARTTIRFFTDSGSQIPAGYDRASPELPAPEGPQFRSKKSNDTIIVGRQILQHRRSGTAKIPEQRDRVELQHLELVINDPRGGVVLIDHQYRIVEVLFAHYRKTDRLRELIDERTAGVPRITAHNALHVDQTHAASNARGPWWKWLVIFPLLVLAYFVLRSALATEPQPDGTAPEQETLESTSEPIAVPEEHDVESAVGETVTLPNWSRVTVKSVEPFEPEADIRMAEGMGTHYLVDVEYCAAEQHDSVDPAAFRMLFGEHALIAHTLEGVEDELSSRELETGQCATGNLGFFTTDDHATDVRVQYIPGDLSSLTWIVDDAG